MIHKDRANRRVVRRKQIKRKMGILKRTKSWYVDLCTKHGQGELAKGKIHCSCPHCTVKSKKYMGKRNRSELNWCMSDRRKFEHMRAEMEAYRETGMNYGE